jgi:hypothetical protein
MKAAWGADIYRQWMTASIGGRPIAFSDGQAPLAAPVQTDIRGAVVSHVDSTGLATF